MFPQVTETLCGEEIPITVKRCHSTEIPGNDGPEKYLMQRRQSKTKTTPS